MSGAFEAILFDFDGVLVDSEPLHFRCWCEIIAPPGLDLTWENYAANCIGVSDKAMIETLCRVTGRPELFDAIWAEYPAKKRCSAGERLRMYRCRLPRARSWRRWTASASGSRW